MVPPFSAITNYEVPESLISGTFSFSQNTTCNKSATKHVKETSIVNIQNHAVSLYHP